MRSVAIGEVAIRVVQGGLAGKDSLSSKFVTGGGDNRAKNQANIDRWPAWTKTFTFYGHQQAGFCYMHMLSCDQQVGLPRRPTIDFLPYRSIYRPFTIERPFSRDGNHLVAVDRKSDQGGHHVPAKETRQTLRPVSASNTRQAPPPPKYQSDH